MKSKVKNNDIDKYKQFVIQTVEMIDYSKIKIKTNFKWFDKYFGENGIAFKMDR